jgi:hypothetical protein
VRAQGEKWATGKEGEEADGFLVRLQVVLGGHLDQALQF